MVVNERTRQPAAHAHSSGGRLHAEGRSRRPRACRTSCPDSRIRARERRRIGWTLPAGWSIAGNPLTARVVVNRIWQTYFGRGLVETDNDFGTQGSYPSHPELLDWLACELMDAGWKQKAIHRLIVSSATYRQASRHRSDGQAIDPDNRLLLAAIAPAPGCRADPRRGAEVQRPADDARSAARASSRRSPTE